MPYVFVEELQDGMEPADVVDREVHNAIIEERDGLVETNATLASELDSARADLREAKKKYANTFITTAQQIKNDHKRDVQSESRPQSFDELFKNRSKNA